MFVQSNKRCIEGNFTLVGDIGIERFNAKDQRIEGNRRKMGSEIDDFGRTSFHYTFGFVVAIAFIRE